MLIDRCLQFTALLMFVAVAGGCQLLGGMESERRYHLAIADDAACTERGYEYPGDAYVECRYELQDSRLRKQWMEMQMSLRQQSAMEPGALPNRSNEPYRPMRREGFRCEFRRDAEQAAWIDCYENSSRK